MISREETPWGVIVPIGILEIPIRQAAFVWWILSARALACFQTHLHFLGRRLLVRIIELHITVMEGEVVRLGDILEVFDENKGVDDIGPQSLFF